MQAMNEEAADVAQALQLMCSSGVEGMRRMDAKLQRAGALHAAAPAVAAKGHAAPAARQHASPGRPQQAASTT